MTGWRVGWLIGPTDVVKAATNLQSHATSNVANVSQIAALAAVSGDLSAVEDMKVAFDRRRHLIVEALNQIPGIECPTPEGAFYVYPSVKGVLGTDIRGHRPASSAELAALILDEVEVAVVPGEAFGTPGYLRLSYATSDDKITEGIARNAARRSRQYTRLICKYTRGVTHAQPLSRQRLLSLRRSDRIHGQTHSLVDGFGQVAAVGRAGIIDVHRHVENKRLRAALLRSPARHRPEVLAAAGIGTPLATSAGAEPVTRNCNCRGAARADGRVEDCKKNCAYDYDDEGNPISGSIKCVDRIGYRHNKISIVCRETKIRKKYSQSIKLF